MDRIRSRFVLVHYNEIALKGKNRGFFEEALVRALRVGLRGFRVRHVKRLYGRVLIELGEELTAGQVGERLRDVFGVSHFEVALRTELSLDALRATLARALEGIDDVASFGIFTKRPNKTFPLNSMAVNAALGAQVVEQRGWKVRLDAPELPIYVYLLEKHAYVAFRRLEGPCGLPAGVAGTVACLLSGGIDSPVAAYRMMRRGCEPVFIHFHSAPFTDAASQEKAIDLTARLLRHKRPAPLFLVPFGELQRRLVASTPAALRVLLYRRFMLRVAERIARRTGAGALVTGEALGQVASQTIENLRSIEAVATLPVFRPLIGMDKVEIIREAERIGTYELSIEPHDDCCSFLMPAHPATRSSPEELAAAERGLDVEAEVERLLAGVEQREVGGDGPGDGRADGERTGTGDRGTRT
jgi:thiamine biosynthesis protein ThiI